MSKKNKNKPRQFTNVQYGIVKYPLIPFIQELAKHYSLNGENTREIYYSLELGIRTGHVAYDFVEDVKGVNKLLNQIEPRFQNSEYGKYIFITMKELVEKDLNDDLWSSAGRRKSMINLVMRKKTKEAITFLNDEGISIGNALDIVTKIVDHAAPDKFFGDFEDRVEYVRKNWWLAK